MIAKPMRPLAAALVLLLFLPSGTRAQSASLVYRLGTDTVAIEQFTRTSTAMSGEMVQRTGAAVARFVYTMEIGRTGRPTTATMRRGPMGSPITNAAISVMIIGPVK